MTSNLYSFCLRVDVWCMNKTLRKAKKAKAKKIRRNKRILIAKAYNNYREMTKCLFVYYLLNKLWISKT